MALNFHTKNNLIDPTFASIFEALSDSKIPPDIAVLAYDACLNKQLYETWRGLFEVYEIDASIKRMYEVIFHPHAVNRKESNSDTLADVIRPLVESDQDSSPPRSDQEWLAILIQRVQSSFSAHEFIRREQSGEVFFRISSDDIKYRFTDHLVLKTGLKILKGQILCFNEKDCSYVVSEPSGDLGITPRSAATTKEVVDYLRERILVSRSEILEKNESLFSRIEEMVSLLVPFFSPSQSVHSQADATQLIARFDHESLKDAKVLCGLLMRLLPYCREQYENELKDLMPICKYLRTCSELTQNVFSYYRDLKQQYEKYSRIQKNLQQSELDEQRQIELNQQIEGVKQKVKVSKKGLEDVRSQIVKIKTNFQKDSIYDELAEDIVRTLMRFLTHSLESIKSTTDLSLEEATKDLKQFSKMQSDISNLREKQETLFTEFDQIKQTAITSYVKTTFAKMKEVLQGYIRDYGELFVEIGKVQHDISCLTEERENLHQKLLGIEEEALSRCWCEGSSVTWTERGGIWRTLLLSKQNYDKQTSNPTQEILTYVDTCIEKREELERVSSDLNKKLHETNTVRNEQSQLQNDLRQRLDEEYSAWFDELSHSSECDAAVQRLNYQQALLGNSWKHCFNVSIEEKSHKNALFYAVKTKQYALAYRLAVEHCFRSFVASSKDKSVVDLMLSNE